MLYLKQNQLERLSADKAAQQILIERELQQVLPYINPALPPNTRPHHPRVSCHNRQEMKPRGFGLLLDRAVPLAQAAAEVMR